MNYLSQPYNIQAPQSSVDLQVVDKTLSVLQKNYDVNSAMIEQTLGMYNQNLKGLRESDNQYIATKLRSVQNTIDQYSKTNGNLAYNYNKDSILSAIKSTLDDPIVSAAVASRQNYMAYNNEAQKVREKGDGKWSDVNYAYGLNQAGYEDYMQGKTKQLGAMQYTPYVNYKEKLIKHAKEFAQQNGQEQLLQENKQHGKYHTVDIYGKIVRKDELKTYLENVLADEDKKQLGIDAWAQYRGVSDNDIISLAESKAKVELKDLESNYAIKKAQLDGGDKSIEPVLSQYKEAIATTKAKIDTRAFSKNDLYNDFANKSLDGIADAFDMNIITKKDVDNATFEELKFEDSQKKWALNYDLDLRKLAASEKTNQILQDQALGTRFDKPVVDDKAEEIPQDLLIKTKVRDGAITLKDELSKVDADFAKFSEAEKYIHLTNLNLSNVAEAKNYPPGFTKKLKEFQQAQRALSNMTESVTNSYRETTTSSFNDMSKEVATGRTELDLDAISEYAPMTANVLKNVRKSGKYFDFNNLSPDVRKSIQVELMNANIKQSPDVDENVKRIAKTSINSLMSSMKDKNIANSTKNNITKVQQEEGFFGKVGAGFAEISDSLIGAVSDLADPFVYGANVLKEGIDYANKQAKLDTPRPTDYGRMSGVLKLNPLDINNYRKANIFSEEENLQNIESRDLGGATNIGSRFQAQNQYLSANIKNYTDSIKKNLDFNYAFMFDTGNKAQKPVADLIEQTVINAETGFKPSKDNNYSIQKLSTGFEISFDTKDGRESVIVQKLPPALAGIVSDSEDRWSDSIYNPLTDFTPVNITPVPNSAEAKRRSDNILNEYPDMPREFMGAIMNTENGIFKPAIEYIRQDVNKEVYAKNKNIIDAFLGQKFTAETEVNRLGQLVSNITFIDVDGQPATKSMTHAMTEKNDALLNIDWYSAIDNIKKERLNSLGK